MSFNRTLIERLKRYFLDYHNLELTDEQAIQYLESLADLYESFSEFAQFNK